MVGHRYGGRHSDDKVNRIRKYLAAYSSALKHQGFHLAYIDAFAGTGVRTQSIPAAPLFGGDEAEEHEITIEGSAKMALSITPPLHELVFIDKKRKHATALQDLKALHPDRGILVIHDDANSALRTICSSTPWRGRNSPGKGIRACLFLDPYGMAVNWETLQAINATAAIDVWYLFPLAGLFRQLARDPKKVDDAKAEAITSMMGTDEWRTALYSRPSQSGQIGFSFDPDEEARSADVDAIEQWAHKRLADVFHHVLPPRRIYIRRAPAFSLFCAITNPNAVRVAEPIASYILKAGISS